MLAALLIATTLVAPVQDVQGRRFSLNGPGAVQFEIPTSAGVVRGEIPISRLETRGIEGWGRFEFRLYLDVASIKTGDTVRDRYIANAILSANDGALVLASTERKPPSARAGQGARKEDEMWSFGGWLDARRGRKYMGVPYAFTLAESNDRGQLDIHYAAPLQDLGLPKVGHPFVEVTGPVTLRLSVELERS